MSDGHYLMFSKILKKHYLKIYVIYNNPTIKASGEPFAYIQYLPINMLTGGVMLSAAAISGTQKGYELVSNELYTTASKISIYAVVQTR